MTRNTEIQNQIDRIWESIDKEVLKGDLKRAFSLGFHQAKTICSFCGKGPAEVIKIVYEDNACICNECVVACVGLIVGKKTEEEDEQREEDP